MTTITTSMTDNISAVVEPDTITKDHMQMSATTRIISTTNNNNNNNYLHSQRKTKTAATLVSPVSNKATWRDKVSDRHKRNLFHNVVLELKRQCKRLQNDDNNNNNNSTNNHCKNNNNNNLIYEHYASEIIKAHWKQSTSCQDFLRRVSSEISQFQPANSRLNPTRITDLTHKLKSDLQNLCGAHRLLEQKLGEKEERETILLEAICFLKQQVSDLEQRLFSIEQQTWYKNFSDSETSSSINNGTTRKRKYDCNSDDNGTSSVQSYNTTENENFDNDVYLNSTERPSKKARMNNDQQEHDQQSVALNILEHDINL